MWRNYVNAFHRGFDMIGSYPLTSKTGRTTGLLYMVQPAVSSNFTPRSGKAMQFTCATACLRGAQANTVSALRNKKYLLLFCIIWHTVSRQVQQRHFCSRICSKNTYWWTRTYLTLHFSSTPHSALSSCSPFPFSFSSHPTPVLGSSVME